MGEAGPNRPVHEIAETEVAPAPVETDLHLTLDLKLMFSQVESAEAEKIGNRDVYVLTARNSGELASKFYFDKESGLLIGILRLRDPRSARTRHRSATVTIVHRMA